MVEDTVTEKSEKKGQTLIAFAHATDIDGKTGDIEVTEGQKIDLERDTREEKTCEAVVKKLGLGFVGKPHRVGGVLAVAESAGYFMFGWFGIIGTALQQTLITPELQDCVDVVEGYYIHLFEPPQPKKKETATPQEKATEKVKEMIRNFAREEREEGLQKNIVDEFKQAFASTAKQLADKAETQKIVQAQVDLSGDSFGRLSSPELFFFWFRGDEVPIVYPTKGRVVIEDPRTGVKLTQDNDSGELSVTSDGKTEKILEKIPGEEARYTPEDHSRLAASDGRVPARKIPQRLTGIGLRTGSVEEIMEMNIESDVSVTHPEILDCIQRGVLEQTGVRMPSNKLSEVFDKAEFVSTQNYSNIHADRQSQTIFAEGSGRNAIKNPNAKVKIRMNAQVEITSNGEQVAAGQLNSIRFRNGVIVYKPESHELIMWLQHNKQAILPGRFVQNLRAIPTTVKNPLNNCEEPAIHLEADPIPGSDTAENNVKNFNESIKKMGPFQVFDTDNKRLMFYSKLENGQCVNRVRIIDKKTGEVYDQPIVGAVEKTPTGVRFRTADGKEHNIDFSAENGVPKLSIDGGLPETLRRAQGPNGSFWYDPETGLWYPENSQLIPLLEAFKQQGFGKQVGPDGSAVTRPGGNPLSISIGAQQPGAFNLPSLPENPLLLFFFILSLLGVIVVFRIRIEKSNAKEL